jgi:phage protein D
MGLGASITVDGQPDDALGAASWLEVHERVGEATTFRLHYDIDVGKGDIPQLSDSRFDAGRVVAVMVQAGGATQCLVKGPVQGQHVRLEHGGDGSYVELRGSDTTIAMDRVTQAALWEDVADSDVASTILARYGYTPDIETTATQHLTKKHALVQRESDLGFIRRLARRNGFCFWVRADGSGVETAHFRHFPLQDAPLATLGINQADRKLDMFDLRWDIERPVKVEAQQLDLNAKSALDGSSTASALKSLGSADLGAAGGGTDRSILLVAPADDVGDLQARATAALDDASWFVQANCEATLETLGALVRAHGVVQLDGAGTRHSGMYAVTAVRHTIDPQRHLMEISLARNGWNQ